MVCNLPVRSKQKVSVSLVIKFIFVYFSAGQKRVLCLWLEKASSPLHLVHMGYGIGSFLVPLFANPFLAVSRSEKDDNSTNHTKSNASIFLIDNSTSEVNDINTSSIEPLIYLRQSRIEYPYAISASFAILMSSVFIYLQIHENRWHKYNITVTNNELKNKKLEQTSNGNNQGRSFREMFNPSSCTRGDPIYGIQIFIVAFIFLGNAGGGERMIGSFIRTFAVDQLGFSGDEASYINSAFWISFTVGRFAFFVSARWIGIRKLILIQTAFIATSTVLLNIFAVHNSLAFWILVQSLGFFLSAMWPTTVAWTDYHMELTGVGMMIIVIGNSIGGICHMRLIGFLYNEYGSRTFLYQTMGYGILALVLAVTLNFIGSKHGNRFKWDETRSPPDIGVKEEQSALRKDSLPVEATA